MKRWPLFLLLTVLVAFTVLVLPGEARADTPYIGYPFYAAVDADTFDVYIYDSDCGCYRQVPDDDTFNELNDETAGSEWADYISGYTVDDFPASVDAEDPWPSCDCGDDPWPGCGEGPGDCGGDPCLNPGAQQLFAYEQPETIVGTRADITRYYPRVCPVSPGGTAAWVGFQATSYPGTAIAQIGWARTFYSTTYVYYFYEYGSTSYLNYPTFISAVPDPSSNASDLYTVYTTDGSTVFRLNGSAVWSTTLDWSPDSATWTGETHSDTDQIPGDTNTPVSFTNMQYCDAGCYSGGWVDASLSFLNYTHYGDYAHSGNSMDIYDNRWSSQP